MVERSQNDQEETEKQKRKKDKTKRKGKKQGQLVDGSPKDQDERGNVKKPNK